MANQKKLSEIIPSPANLAVTDTLVGVTAGPTDVRFTRAQVSAGLVGTGVIYAADYGAVGDGVHNDAPNLQAAHDAALSSGGGIVFLNPTAGFGTYAIGQTLNWSDRVGLMGVGEHPTFISALGAINMMVWSGSGGDPANKIEGVKFEGNNVALSGCIVGFGQQFFMRNVQIQNCVNDGLVLSQTQNSTFINVFTHGCGLANYRLAGTAWNNTFIRCGSDAPGNSAYHLLSRNSSAYNTLTGGHTLLNNRHNTWWHPIMERSTPLSIIRLEDDDGDNGFYEVELQGGSTGNPQVYIGSSCSDSIFYHGTVASGGVSGNGLSFAFDNFGFGTQIINMTGTGWSGVDWIRNTSPGTVFVATPLGGPGNLNVASGGGTQTDVSFFSGSFYYQLGGGNFLFSENGNDGQILGPAFLANGSVVPKSDLGGKLGNSVRRWNNVDAKSITSYTATELIASGVTLNNGAGASTGTLTNAPAAGNPTKWISINDNGVTRKIPAW